MVDRDEIERRVKMENVVKESEREKLKKEMDEDLEGKESI